jgi:hypothetical protein
MKTVTSLYPSSINNLAEIQLSTQKIAATVNANSLAPLVIQHRPSETLSTSASTTGKATYLTHVIYSKGGLVSVAANISASGDGYVGLSIDGTAVIQVPVASGAVSWNKVLGSGKHIISLIYGANSGTVTINPAGYSSAISIQENPSNITGR